MRSRLTILVSAAALLVAPLAALAGDDIDTQLQLMNERMEQMEQQLQATQDELGASKDQVSRQSALIEKAGLDREGQSGLSNFFSAVEVGGWVAADWFWNFNNPGDAAISKQNQSPLFSDTSVDGGTNQGHEANFYPFHPDHNSFSVSQLWIELEKPVTAESRGGFRADLAYGKTAGLLSYGVQRTCGGPRGFDGSEGDFDDVDDCKGDAASDFNLYQAYVQYLIPGLEATLKAGKFGTHVGTEVAPTVYNWNITRGILYSLMEPITHTGVMIDGQMGPLNLGIGVANSGLPPNVDPDFNNAKTILATAGIGGETMSLTGNLVWGPESFDNSAGDIGLVNVITTFDPSESFSAWINFDYVWTDDPGAGSTDNVEAWGVAVAGRLALTEAAGFALRGEWAKDHNNFFGFDGNGEGDVVWSITGTFDYSLTDNLMVRAEARWDTVSEAGVVDNVFIDNSDNSPDEDRGDQVVTGIELVYQF